MADRPLAPPSRAHLKSLEGKKQKLERRIAEEEKSPSSADFYLKQLKRQKLLIKDKIYSLMDELEEKKANLC